LKLVFTFAKVPAMNLVALTPGEAAVVARVALAPEQSARLAAFGIAPGAEVRVLRRGLFGGPLHVRAAGAECALGRDLAAGIEVRASAAHASRAEPRQVAREPA
jgi:Fe2+ transport system protein FeoA